jgi:hypothetical protein
VITVAYVNAVLAQLDHVYSGAVRTALAAKTIPPSVITTFRALYADPLYATELNVLRDEILQPPANLKPNPGDLITTVKSIIGSSPSCIFISTTPDYSQILSGQAPEPASEYYSLVTKSTKDDPNHLNPTPWEFGYNFDSFTPQTVANQCPGA